MGGVGKEKLMIWKTEEELAKSLSQFYSEVRKQDGKESVWTELSPRHTGRISSTSERNAIPLQHSYWYSKKRPGRKGKNRSCENVTTVRYEQ